MLEITSPTTMPVNSVSDFAFNNFSSLSATESFDYNNSTEFLDRNWDNFNETSLYERCDPSYPFFNCTIDEYLFVRLGAKAQPLDEAIWVSFTRHKQQHLYMSAENIHESFLKTNLFVVYYLIMKGQFIFLQDSRDL